MVYGVFGYKEKVGRKASYMNAEVIGVSFFQSEISKTDYLVPNININDKGLSWDGDVEVYRKPANNHKKEDLILKVPVQVNGMKIDDISKSSLSYPVEIADMRNYLHAGGTIFIVVCFDSTGENKKIFFARLLPYELRQILNRYGIQKTRKVELELFPTNKVDIEILFLNVARDMKAQRGSLVCSATTLQDLEGITEVTGFTVGYAVGRRYGETPFDYLFDNGAYIYAKVSGGFEVPIDRVGPLESASRIIHSPVCVNGKVFYDTYKMVYKKDAVEINIGKSIKYTIERQYDGLAKLTFTLNGTLSERICDAEFIVEAVKNRQFTVGTVVQSLDAVTPMKIDELNVPKLEKYLEWLRSIKQVMDKLHVKKELAIADLSKDDEHKIKLLKSAVIDGLAVPLKRYAKVSFGNFTVANLKFLVTTIRQDGEDDLYDLYSFNDTLFGINGKIEDGEIFQTSHYILLKKEDFLACCNIDYDIMVAHIKSIPITIHFVDQVFTLFFELLKAYDEMPQKEILISAIEIAEWFKEKDLFTPKPIWLMNYYQSVKRLRSLENQERQDILSIIENKVDEEIYVGAYILLGDSDAARRHFEQMDGERQAAFQQYPIWQLWEK